MSKNTLNVKYVKMDVVNDYLRVAMNCVSEGVEYSKARKTQEAVIEKLFAQLEAENNKVVTRGKNKGQKKVDEAEVKKIEAHIHEERLALDRLTNKHNDDKKALRVEYEKVINAIIPDRVYICYLHTIFGKDNSGEFEYKGRKYNVPMVVVSKVTKSGKRVNKLEAKKLDNVLVELLEDLNFIGCRQEKAFYTFQKMLYSVNSNKKGIMAKNKTAYKELILQVVKKYIAEFSTNWVINEKTGLFEKVEVATA